MGLSLYGHRFPSMVVSGRKIEPCLAKTLMGKGYPSHWWISHRYIERLDLNKELLAEPYVTPNGFHIYNISQLKEALKLEKYAGKVFPTWAIDNTQIQDSVARAIFEYISDERSNEWIKEEDISVLGGVLRESREGVVLQLSKDSSRTLYNIDDIENAKQFRENANLYPISANSGKRFSAVIAQELLYVAKERKYTSPFWITDSHAKWTSCQILELEKPTKFTNKGVECMVYNADQTKCPSRVASVAIRNVIHPIDLKTDKQFKEPLASTLIHRATVVDSIFDTYWTNRLFAQDLGAQVLPGDPRTYTFFDKERRYRFINTNATKGPSSLRWAASQHRRNTPKSPRNDEKSEQT